METNLVVKVPNNPEGKEFIRLFRKFTKGTKVKTLCRGRHPERRKVMKEKGMYINSCHDIPCSVAQTIAIYIKPKHGFMRIE